MHLELVAFIAGLISSTAAIPQLYRMIKYKKAGSVSTFMFCMKNCSNSLWIVFGVMSGVFFVVFWNVISLILCTSVIIMKYKILREREQSKTEKLALVVPIYTVMDNTLREPEIELAPKRPALKLVYCAPREVHSSANSSSQA